MKLAGQEVKSRPEIPDEQTRLLRAKLILEEALETIEALGVQVWVDQKQDRTDEPLSSSWVGDSRLVFHDTDGGLDLEKIADGCADLSVVTVGTLSACGIADGPLLREVDRSNEAKFVDGPIMREDGKYLKPEGWEPPNIKGILQEQGWNDPPSEFCDE